MALNGTDLVIVAGLFVFGCLTTYFCLRRMVTRVTSELQRKTQDELKAVRRTIAVLEARIAELSQTAAVPIAPLTPALTEKEELSSRVQLGTVIPFPKRQTKEEVPPEVVVVIAAAVTAFLGKKVRIRSAKRLQTPYEIVNPWAQQGRVIVQASHNLLSGLRSEKGFAERNSSFEVANRH